MKILVRSTNWIGDAVMSIPAMRELSRIFPDAHITLQTRPWANGIFNDSDFVNEIIAIDTSLSRIRSIRNEVGLLRAEKFDLAVIFPNSFESALVPMLAGIPRRIGYNKDLRGLLLSDPIAVPEWKYRKHEVFYYLNLVSEVEKRILGSDNVASREPDISLCISEEPKTKVREMLVNAGVDVSRPTIGLGVGSTNSRAKRWPAKSYAELNDRLKRELNTNVVLLGSKDEIDIAAEVSSISSEQPVDLAGKTDLSDAAAILSILDFFVSNDMGLAHISAAVGTKTITIFGPTNPETTRPFGTDTVIIRKVVHCSPCMLRDCPIDHRCMTWISPDEVFETVTTFMQSKADEAISNAT
ncbi:MAG: lipopolysaccharide heptosyltransferase II [Blastocatellia bacterium]